MRDRNLNLTLTVDQSPEEVYAAIANVRGWWSEGIEGRATRIGDEFTFRHKDVHRSTHRVTLADPGKLMLWHTTDSNLSFTDEPREWVGTDVRFEIERKGDRTELRFTHVGLTPDLACFEACSKGWGFYVATSLFELITTGKGQPDAKSCAANAA
jgi:hypothetical protein